MGASSTTATIVSLQNVKTKETIPQTSVIGVGYDRTFGGLELQIRLRDLLKKFHKLKTSTNEGSGRLKNVLSANTKHYAQVEGLLDKNRLPYAGD